jgi:hypothetical protein
MSLAGVDVEIDLSLEEALDAQDACEGPLHPSGQNGHDPSAPAAWLLIPRCGHDILMCDAWLRSGDELYGVDGWTVECHRCHQTTDATDLMRIPLDTSHRHT